MRSTALPLFLTSENKEMGNHEEHLAMKKLVFAFLFISLFLTGCIAIQASVDSQTPLATTAPALSQRTETPVSTNTTEQPQVAQTLTPIATAALEMSTWVAPAMPTAGEKLSFQSLDMSDPDTGWGIDIFGRIFHTSDGGQTWILASPPDGAYTNGGFFARDGLTAWAAKDVPVRCWDDWAIYHCDHPYYAAVKSGTVWKSTDGGQNWQPSQSFPLHVENAPYSFDGALPFSPIGLQFIDTQTGWLLVAVGQSSSGEQSLLYRTGDGGNSWELTQAFGFEGNAYSCRKRGFAFADGDNGWLIANCPEEESNIFPTLLQTTDGGKSWLPDSQVQEILIPSDNPGGLLIFQPPLSGESLQRYPDGSLGTHILHYFSNADAQILTFFRLGNQEVDNWISGVEFYKPSVSQQGGWMTMGSEYFLDTDQGWRFYWDMSTNGRWLQKTMDGGKTWESIKSVAWTTARFEFVDAQTGWAIVTGGAGQPVLVRTTDGGATWGLLAAGVGGSETLLESLPALEPTPNSPLTNVSAFWMIDHATGWAVTQDDQLLRTTDGGQIWQNVTPPPEYKAYKGQCRHDIVSVISGLKPDGFFALDADHAWVAQHGCTAAAIAIWKTADGGGSWRKVPLTAIPATKTADLPPFFNPRSLFFEDAVHGWLVVGLYASHRSFEDYLFQTPDGGDSWKLVSDAPLSCYPYCVGAAFPAPGTIWLADDQRYTPAVSDFLSFDYSDDGGKTWEQKMVFNIIPPLPVNPTYTARIGKLNWGDDFSCGTLRLQKFPHGRIGAFSSCHSSYSTRPYFSIDYMTIIDENASLKIMTDGVLAQDATGKYGYGHFGGWTSNQTDYFYNDQFGWRLYIGTNADENGPVYLQRTQDGGEAWETILPVPWQNARFQFLDPENGWALVTLPWGNAIVRTADGGKTWQEITASVEKE